jgi:hypothetical protein
MKRTTLAALFAACLASLALAGPASAAVYTVDDLDDTHDSEFPGPFNDDVCNATGADTCTLRAALDEANDTPAGSDIINIAVAGTINLLPANDELLVGENATVNGNAAVTTVDAGGNSGVFTTGGSSVTLNDLRIEDGATLDNDGAGILSVAALLTLNRVTVTGNTVDSDAGGSGGAGIGTFGVASSLVLNDSTVSGNNIIGISGIGAGIKAQGPLTINRSTISGNTTTLDASGRGGGIDMAPAATVALTISNSTISGNSSGGNMVGAGGGGGVNANSNVTATIVGSTIAGNSTLGVGGGVRLVGGGMSENTIYAANTSGTTGTENCGNGANFTTPENNIETGLSCNLGATNGNQENVTTGQLGLGGLAPNGGPTQTRAIAQGSVAQNAASGDCGGLGVDQRGVLRPQGASCDVGAFELEPTTTPPPGGVGQTPAPPAKKKCKKGRKLKKGKCVKKKKKKK